MAADGSGNDNNEGGDFGAAESGNKLRADIISPRRAHGNHRQQGASPAGSGMGGGPRGRYNLGRKLHTGLLLLIVVLLIAGAVMYTRGRSATAGDTAINTKEYQAVFLTNGQVYFGKLSKLNSKYITLQNIYYLQVQSDGSTSANVQPAGSADQSQVSLAKLGNELHGPEDNMQIASQQVLFWENLKDSGKVVQAIKAYQDK